MKWLEKLQANQKPEMNLVIVLLLAGAIGLTWQLIRPLVFNADIYDFNSHYLAAYATQHGLDPYDLDTLQVLAKELHIRKVTIYRYPPFHTMLMMPLGALPYPVADFVWRILNLAFTALCIWLIGKTMSLEFSAKNLLVVGLIVFNYDPLIYTIAIGQVNMLILTLLMLAVFAFSRKRTTLSGVFLGLAASSKIIPGVLLAYFFWKKNYRMVMASAVTIVTSAAIGFLALGAETTRTFINVFMTFAQEDNSWIGNQSLRGFLSRLFVGDEFVHAWYPDASLERNLYYLGVAIFAAFTAFVLYRSRRTGTFHVEFAFVFLTYFIITPTTWVHHLVWAMYPLVAIALACLDRKNLAPAIVFVIGFSLIGLTFEYRSDALWHWPQALWISTKLYGLLILYGLTAWLLLKPVSQNLAKVD
jgi:alpha-1,2-mannosyltransferase